jgi:putative phosphoesterase
MSSLVGVISDTHGVMRPDALDALRGSDLIIHAGDIGSPAVLDALYGVARVNAVRGNVDVEPWADTLPLVQLVQVENVRIQVIHRIADLRLEADVRCVITGHSHAVRQTRDDGVLYLNPGSAGPRRFRLPVTLMRVRIEGSTIEPEVISLAK